MAEKTALADMNTLFSLNQNLSQCLANYKIFFEDMERFKEDVIDDPIRKAELKNLIDAHTEWTIEKINTKYNEHKTIYDYLKELE